MSSVPSVVGSGTSEQPRRRWFFRDPPWLIRDGLLALVIGGLLVSVQFQLDNRISEREQAIETERAKLAERLENLRYVRERADSLTGPDGNPLKAFNNLDLAGMNFRGLDLSGAIFWGANLDRADFTTSDLSGASFGAGAMTAGGGSADGAIFERTRLWNSQFTGWDGDRANFSSAELQGAQFVDGSYVGADFAGADLRGATFSIVDFSQALNLDTALFDEGCYSSVTWPAGYQPPPERPDCQG